MEKICGAEVLLNGDLLRKLVFGVSQDHEVNAFTLSAEIDLPIVCAEVRNVFLVNNSSVHLGQP